MIVPTPSALVYNAPSQCTTPVGDCLGLWSLIHLTKHVTKNAVHGSKATVEIDVNEWRIRIVSFCFFYPYIFEKRLRQLYAMP